MFSDENDFEIMVLDQQLPHPRLGCFISDGIENWYTIELMHHANIFEIRERKRVGTTTYNYLYYSGRVSDADVEGSGGEMLAIADALRARTDWEAYRCAVAWDTQKEMAYLWSPRNSRARGAITKEDADALADSIERVVGARALPQSPHALPAQVPQEAGDPRE